MNSTAVVFDRPRALAVRPLALTRPTPADVIVDVQWSGVSTGTERLLWTGAMPAFPGMGYPLVPGYESVGRISEAGAESGRDEGDMVFVPGARCFTDARCLFGGTASRLIVPGARTIAVPETLAETAALFALAATAYHAIIDGATPPELVVGHGALGRLIARVVVALGASPPLVWESNPARHFDARGYAVVDADSDPRRDYRCICDVSGDPSLIDTLITRLAPRGELVLAAFYAAPVSFEFPPAFMRSARLRVAAEWQPADMAAVRDLVTSGALSLDGLVTHRVDARAADVAYATAFEDSACVKMILDWRQCA